MYLEIVRMTVNFCVRQNYDDISQSDATKSFIKPFNRNVFMRGDETIGQNGLRKRSASHFLQVLKSKKSLYQKKS